MSSKQTINEIEKALVETDKALKKIRTEIAKRKAAKQSREYRALTPEEARRVDDVLKRVNQQQRKRYGIGSDLAGVEIR